MAKPTTHTFGEFLIEIESADSPGVYYPPCGLTSKAFNRTATTQESTVPDCNDPDAPAETQRAIDTLSNDISGEGILAEEAFDTWEEWYSSGLARSCRIYPMGLSKGYYGGQFLLTQFNLAGERGQKTKVSVAMQGDGLAIWNAPGSP